MRLEHLIEAVVALIFLGVVLVAVVIPIAKGGTLLIKRHICTPKILVAEYIGKAPPIAAGPIKQFAEWTVLQSAVIDCNIEFTIKDFNKYYDMFDEKIIDRLNHIRELSPEFDYLNFEEYKQFMDLIDYDKVYSCIRGEMSDKACTYLKYLIFLADIYRRLDRILYERPVYDVEFTKVEIPKEIKDLKLTEGDITFAFALFGVPYLNDNLPVEENRYVTEVILNFVDKSKLEQVAGSDVKAQRKYLTELLHNIGEVLKKKYEKHIDLCMYSPIDLSKKTYLEIKYWGGKWTRQISSFFTGSVCGRGVIKASFILL